MADNSRCLKHDAEIENIKKEIARIESKCQKEIDEVKEENRIQNKEFRAIFANFADIKEAVVTSAMTLERLNEKMDSQEQSQKNMSEKFEKTTQELSEKFDHLDRKVENKLSGLMFVWDNLIKKLLPLVLIVGIWWLLSNIETFIP